MRSRLDKVVAEVGQQPSPEIEVAGHTDFIGTDQYNDTLSLQCARRVRDLPIQRSIPARLIHAAGRGKREPWSGTPKRWPNCATGVWKS
jgi:outer membrane protein OmpA-like peptidoglycan-associated protein